MGLFTLTENVITTMKDLSKHSNNILLPSEGIFMLGFKTVLDPVNLPYYIVSFPIVLPFIIICLPFFLPMLMLPRYQAREIAWVQRWIPYIGAKLAHNIISIALTPILVITAVSTLLFDLILSALTLITGMLFTNAYMVCVALPYVLFTMLSNIVAVLSDAITCTILLPLKTIHSLYVPNQMSHVINIVFILILSPLKIIYELVADVIVLLYGSAFLNFTMVKFIGQSCANLKDDAVLFVKVLILPLTVMLEDIKSILGIQKQDSTTKSQKNREMINPLQCIGMFTQNTKSVPEGTNFPLKKETGYLMRVARNEFDSQDDQSINKRNVFNSQDDSKRIQYTKYSVFNHLSRPSFNDLFRIESPSAALSL